MHCLVELNIFISSITAARPLLSFFFEGEKVMKKVDVEAEAERGGVGGGGEANKFRAWKNVFFSLTIFPLSRLLFSSVRGTGSPAAAPRPRRLLRGTGGFGRGA